MKKGGFLYQNVSYIIFLFVSYRRKRDASQDGDFVVESVKGGHLPFGKFDIDLEKRYYKVG